LSDERSKPRGWRGSQVRRAYGCVLTRATAGTVQRDVGELHSAERMRSCGCRCRRRRL